MRLSSFFLLGLVLSLCACGKPPAPVATAPAAKGPRIISTVPAAALNIVLIGGVDALVGVSPYDTLYLPDDKKDLPAVGDYNLEKLNYEQLINLHPTALVVQ